MKSWILLFFSASLFQLQTSCKSGKPNGNTNISEKEDSIKQELIIDENFQRPDNNDPLTIKNLKLQGNVLDIEVEYSGGCKEHEFKLYFNKLYMKSLPPKAKFFLVHNANGDTCREFITKTISFDISPAQYPDGKTKEIIIIVEGSDKTVNYTY